MPTSTAATKRSSPPPTSERARESTTPESPSPLESMARPIQRESPPAKSTRRLAKGKGRAKARTPTPSGTESDSTARSDDEDQTELMKAMVASKHMEPIASSGAGPSGPRSPDADEDMEPPVSGDEEGDTEGPKTTAKTKKGRTAKTGANEAELARKAREAEDSRRKILYQHAKGGPAGVEIDRRKVKVVSLPWSASAPRAVKSASAVKPEPRRERGGPNMARPHTLPDEWFIHSEGNSHPYAEALVGIPFDLWCCQPFWDMVEEWTPRLKTNCFPTRAQFDTLISSLETAYPHFLSEARNRARRRGQLDGSRFQVQTFVGRRKTAAEEDPDQSEPEETLPGQRGVAEWRMRGKPWFTPYRKRYARYPVPSMDLPKRRAADTASNDDDGDGALTDSDVFEESDAEFGVGDREIPPWECQMLLRWMPWFIEVVGAFIYDQAFEAQLAAKAVRFDKRKTQTRYVWDHANQKVVTKKTERATSAGAPNYPPSWTEESFLKRVASGLFGEWAVDEQSGGMPDWAMGPPTGQRAVPKRQMSPHASKPSAPGQPTDNSQYPDTDEDDDLLVIPDDPADDPHLGHRRARYSKQVREVISNLVGNQQRKERRPYEAILQKDVEMHAKWHPIVLKQNKKQLSLADSIPHIQPFFQDLQIYHNLTRYHPMWVKGLEQVFLKSALKCAALSPADLRQHAITLSAAEIEEIRHQHEMFVANLDQEDAEGRTAAEQRRVRAEYVDSPEDAYSPPPEVAKMLDRDYGVEPFAAMDPIDLIAYLGFEQVQDPNSWNAAVSAKIGEEGQDSSKYPHLCKRDDNGDLILHNGEPIFLNQSAHEAREKITWPFLAQFFPQPLNEKAWEKLCQNAKGKIPQPDDTTHNRIVPKWHQIVCVASILSRGFCANSWTEPSFATLLADDVGFGKTWIPFMLIGALRYYREQRAKDPAFNPPVFDANKTLWKKVDAEIPSSPPTASSQWVGDTRLGIFGQSFGRIHLLLSNKSIYSGHVREAENLTRAPIIFMDYVKKVTRSNPSSRQDFWRAVREASAASNQDVIVISTYGHLLVDAAACPSNARTDRGFAQYSLFDPGVRFTTVFVDEIAEMRVPTSRVHLAVRRIAERSGYIIGATATPIYTSAMDIINIGRCMGMVPVVRRDHVTPIELKTNASNGALPDQPYSGNTDTTELTDAMKRLVTKFNELDAAGRRLRARLAGAARKGKKKDTTNPEDERTAMIDRNLVQLAKKHDTLADDTPVGLEGDLKKDWEAHIGKVEQELLKPLRAIFANHIVRRSTHSVDYCGRKCSTVKPVTPQEIWVDLEGAEKEAYEAFESQLDARDKQFDSKLRRFLREPNAVVTGFWDPQKPTPAALATAIDMVRNFLNEDQPLAAQTRRKIVIHTQWTSLVPFFQAHFAKAGIPTCAMTGQDTETERAHIIRDFQRDDDMVPDHLLELGTGSFDDIIGDDAGARVLFISNIGLTGITLHRASIIILLDPSWSYADVQQVIGRVNRMNQTREVFAYAVYIRGTCEEKMYRLAGSKRESANFLLGDRRPDDAAATHMADVSEAQTPDRDIREARRERLVREETAGEIAFVTHYQPFVTTDPYLVEDDRETPEPSEKVSKKGRGTKRTKEATAEPLRHAALSGYDQSDEKDRSTIVNMCQVWCPPKPSSPPTDMASLDLSVRYYRFCRIKIVCDTPLVPGSDDDSKWTLVRGRTLLCRLFRAQDPIVCDLFPQLIDLIVPASIGVPTSSSVRWPLLKLLLQRIPNPRGFHLDDPMSYVDESELLSRPDQGINTHLDRFFPSARRPQEQRHVRMLLYLYNSLGSISPSVTTCVTLAGDDDIALLQLAEDRANHVRRLLFRLAGLDPANAVSEGELTIWWAFVSAIAYCDAYIPHTDRLAPDHWLHQATQLAGLCDFEGAMTQAVYKANEVDLKRLRQVHKKCKGWNLGRDPWRDLDATKLDLTHGEWDRLEWLSREWDPTNLDLKPCKLAIDNGIFRQTAHDANIPKTAKKKSGGKSKVTPKAKSGAKQG